MKRHATGKNVGTFNYAGDTIMKVKSVIRIRRKNEFNRYWAFLLFWAVMVGIALLKADTLFEGVAVMFSASVVAILALLYQGFEIIKE